MRAVLAILLVSLALPAWAGPADPWTIDPAKSRIAFSVEQVGKIASGRIGGVELVKQLRGEILRRPAPRTSTT